VFTRVTEKNFKAIWDKKRELLLDNPEKAIVTVKADSELVEGFMSRVKVRDFEVIVDQHKGMGGFDKGPRPSEYVLAALAACHEVTYRLHADALGIPLESVSVSVTGHSDARGFFRLNENTRAGFSKITGEIRIRSSATDDDLQRLKLSVNSGCPVLDDLTQPVPVDLVLIRD
jgi:putative redox protein